MRTMHAFVQSKIFHYCECKYKQVKHYLLISMLFLVVLSVINIVFVSTWWNFHRNEILRSGSTVHLYESSNYPSIHWV